MQGTEVVRHYEKTEPTLLATASQMQKYEKWIFNWNNPDLDDCFIYALYVKGSNQTQGLNISMFCSQTAAPNSLPQVT